MSKVEELVKNIIEFPSTIAKDKLGHFFGGSFILFVSLLLFNVYISVGIVVVSAATKELLWDGYLKKGNVEFYDFVYTILPCIFYLINITF